MRAIATSLYIKGGEKSIRPSRTAGSGGVIVTRSNDLAHKLAKIYANVPEESLPPADRKCRLGLRRAHPSVVPRHGRVTDRPPSPAETREAGASNTGQ